MKVNQEEIRKTFEEGVGKIKKDDIQKVLEKKEEIEEKLKGPLTKYIEDIKNLYAMLKCWWEGKFDTPWFTVAAIAFALLYVINPIDIIPDAIPVVGLLDDAAVIALCMKFIEEDLARFRRERIIRGC